MINKKLIVLVAVVLVALAAFVILLQGGQVSIDQGTNDQGSTDQDLADQVVPSYTEWRTDDVVLMSDSTTESFGCYGCGETQCIDPTPGLELVDETEEQHCNGNFNFISTIVETS